MHTQESLVRMILIPIPNYSRITEASLPLYCIELYAQKRHYFLVILDTLFMIDLKIVGFLDFSKSVSIG